MTIPDSPRGPDTERPQPPTAKVVPQVRVHLGRTLVDPYAWLQDLDDPDVLAYLEAENAYARSVLQPTEPLQERLVQEMRARMPEEDCSAPQVRGDFLYYFRYLAGRQYRVFCRRRRAPGSPEQVILDENELARGQAYTFVGAFVPSPDHRYLAYAVDHTGAWVWDLFVKDLETGQLVTDRIRGHRPHGGVGQRQPHAVLHLASTTRTDPTRCSGTSSGKTRTGPPRSITSRTTTVYHSSPAPAAAPTCC